MEINRNAPATAEGELRIDADLQTVFSVIAAIDQWPSWNPNVKSVSVEGPVQPGTVLRWKAGPSSLTSTLQPSSVTPAVAPSQPSASVASCRCQRFSSRRIPGGSSARPCMTWMNTASAFPGMPR